jgi:glycerol-3-phosphate dehydrogenase
MEPLSSTVRIRNLARMKDERFDVLVIGGGVTGAGVAVDAAARGYRVALVEKTDFASGTSSKSTKLVHGGIRYLPNFDFALGPNEAFCSKTRRFWLSQWVLFFLFIKVIVTR